MVKYCHGIVFPRENLEKFFLKERRGKVFFSKERHGKVFQRENFPKEKSWKIYVI